MKKLLFITFCVLTASFCSPEQSYAQGSKIEDFIKNNSTQKGASYVEMSKAMLDAAFENSVSGRAGRNQKSTTKYPHKFKSLVLNETSKADELKKILSGKDYEVLMESVHTKEGKNKASYESKTSYYFRNSANENEKEIVILQLESNKRLSITYMQGDLSINNIQNYLINIRVKLGMMGVNSGLSSGLENQIHFKWGGTESMNQKLENMREELNERFNYPPETEWKIDSSYKFNFN